MQCVFSLMECSHKNCKKQKQDLENDKVLYKKYAELKLETNYKKKIELINELSKNDIMFEYDKCVLVNCKKMFYELMTILRINLDTIPKSNPKYQTLTTLITELETIIQVPNMNKTHHKTFIKNITELMQNIK